jgi:surface polysaccharide O-acyltransferase-like enzyme
MTGLTISKTLDIFSKTFVAQKCSLRYLTLLFSVIGIVPFLCFIQKHPVETATLIILVLFCYYCHCSRNSHNHSCYQGEHALAAIGLAATDATLKNRRVKAATNPR